jgi:cytidine deaminase
MREQRLELKYSITDDISELSVDDRELITSAREAALRAYAPYSNFRVGAALRMDDGKIVSGNNQENAAYPSGICAERVALFYSSSQQPGKAIKKIAIYSPDTPDEAILPVTPCGSCRQVMAEYEGMQDHHIEVLLISERGSVWKFDGVSTFLPFTFSSRSLGGR